MRKNKIGAVFLVSVLAIAGLGISYAGFYDDIYVYGSVSTATVEFEILNYSGTWVFKVWGFDPIYPPEAPDLPGWFVTWIPDEETLILRGFRDYYGLPWADLNAWVDTFGGDWEIGAYAFAYPEMYEDEVGMFWWQVFPCIDFTADVIIHYTGCIPAHITIEDFDFYGDLAIFDYIELHYYEYTAVYDDLGNIIGWEQGAEILDLPVQIHYCDYIGIFVTIHLPQDNDLQGLVGGFDFNIHALQWNELCESVDLPPVVDIYNAENGQGWQIDVSASDDYGIVSYGYLWEWTGGSEAASGTVDPPELYINNIGGYFWLKDGWNKITFFAYDTAGQYGEDSIVIIV